MKFSSLVDQAKKLWPPEIDISDGVLGPNDSARFPNMSAIQDRVEGLAPNVSEWQDLMTWSIFVGYHALAKEKLKRGDLSPAKFSEIDWLLVEKYLSDTLYSRKNWWPSRMKREYENDLDL